MGGAPLVSIIMIFFNAERFISEAIDSVFAQSYENWELLLVDDGSTDRSRELVVRYVERCPNRVRLLEHDGHPNLGTGASRNLGIREAKGEYIAFLDSDDVWLPQKLERQVADLESHPEAEMVYGPTHFWFGWTTKLEDRQRDFISPLGIRPNTLVRPPTLFTICQPLGEAPPAATCSLMLRRSALDRIGGFEDSFRGLYEDQAFLVKVYLRGSVFVSGDCLAKYRMHPDSSVFSSLRSGDFDRSRRFFLNWLQGFLDEEQVTDEAIRNALNKVRWPYLHPVRHRYAEVRRRAALWGDRQW
jgi:glycosyltransferase involved in cell wall biosynthesis